MTTNCNRRLFLKSAGLGAAVSAAAAGTLAYADDAQGPLKIIGISCSERAGKTTAAALRIALEAAEAVGPDHVATELIELAGLAIPTSPAAGIALPDEAPDDFPAVATKLRDPRLAGLIIGTPVYFANMSARCKAFLERCGMFRKDGFGLSGKVAGVLAIGGVRNGGQELTIQSVQAALLCQEMLIVGDGRPTAHTGATLLNQQDSIDDDEFGQLTATNLGRHVAEVALTLRQHV